MAKRLPKSFWTQDKLKELALLVPNQTLRQLERKFGRRAEDITQAYEFWIQHKKLKRKTVKRKGYRITFYHHGYAEGAEQCSRFIPDNSVEILLEH